MTLSAHIPFERPKFRFELARIWSRFAASLRQRSSMSWGRLCSILFHEPNTFQLEPSFYFIPDVKKPDSFESVFLLFGAW